MKHRSAAAVSSELLGGICRQFTVAGAHHGELAGV